MSSQTESELVRAAEKAGMHDPALIAKLVDAKDFKVNDDGSVSGIEEAVAKLKESHAYLFKAIPTFDPDKPIVDQVRAIVWADEDAQIDKFLATKPDGDAALKAVKTGDFSC